MGDEWMHKVWTDGFIDWGMDGWENWWIGG